MRTVILTSAIVVSLISSATSAEPLTLDPHDHVVFIGNTLFDRDQNFAYFETLVQQRHPKHELVVRTLAWSGDEVALRPRPEDFADLHEHLSTQKADVIIAAYGFNESFRGEAGAAGFKADLTNFIAELRRHKYNGKTPPRIVLVSPIGYEDPGSPLPDGVAMNAHQMLYAAVMETVAKETGVGFVNVLKPMLTAMSEKNKPGPLTINGIHLGDAGYRVFADALYREVFREDAPAVSEPLRRAVLDKSARFFHWYRTLNAFYIYGGRKKPYGVENFPLELTKWSQMVDNRDRRIWAITRGEAVPDTIDDSSTVELPKIKGDRPINEWMTAAEEMKHFTVDPRFEVNCFASEEDFPELACPIQMRWDGRGRLWVSCSTSYPQVAPGETANDKLIILEDTDGDGRADKCGTFAEGLHIPRSFEFGDGGVYVSEQPHLTFLKDTDGDGKADVRENVLTGFGSEDSHHALHDFAWSPDGDLIFRESIFHHSQVETPYGPVRVHESGFFRYRPVTGRLLAFGSYRSTNPWGITFDKWGRHLGSHPVFASAIHALNPPYPRLHVPAGEYIPAYSGTCGQGFIYSKQWPDELQGSFVRGRYKPTQTVELQKWVEHPTHFEEQKIEPLIRSSDLSFIPVDVRFGPRGDLYICDWYNPVKGHMRYSLRDTRRDKTSGRIWRVVAKGRPLRDPPKIADASIAELLEHLRAYEYRTRCWARRELRERDAGEVGAALDRWVASLDPKDAEFDHHRTEALWMYRGIGAVRGDLLRALLESPDHHARAAATRQLRYWHAEVNATAHNLLICMPGSEDAVGLAAVELAKTDEGMKLGFVPKSDRVLHATRLLNPGESETLRFHAPKEPGEYPYICSFPGHWLVTKGKMIVKP